MNRSLIETVVCIVCFLERADMLQSEYLMVLTRLQWILRSLTM